MFLFCVGAVEFAFLSIAVGAHGATLIADVVIIVVAVLLVVVRAAIERWL